MVVAIVGIISSTAPQLFIQITRFFQQNQARADIQREARTAFELMGRNLRQAKASTIVISAFAGEAKLATDGLWASFTACSGWPSARWQSAMIGR